MKRLLACVLLLVSLTACAGGASSPDRHNCSAGGEICIEVHADEPISFGEPVSVTITVTSEKDIPDLGVYFTTWPQSIVIQEPVNDEPGQVSKRDQSWVNWLVEVKHNQPVTFTRKINLPPEEGLFDIQASAATTILHAETSIGIHMTREGGKVYLSGTPIPITPGPELVDTMDPNLLATLQARPTETPYPTLTAVPTTEAPPLVDQGTPAYPPPETPYP